MSRYLLPRLGLGRLRHSLHPSPLAVNAAYSARRSLATTHSYIIDEKNKPVKAGEHAKASSVEKPVSDHAKEVEHKRTGVPEDPGDQPAVSTLAAKRTPELFSLANRTIIVTGGGRGLGLTVAQSLLETGANVACVDLLPEASEPHWSQSVEYAKKNGLRLTYNGLDVTDQSAVHTLFAQIFDSVPSSAPVRGLFTAAGIQMLKAAVDYTPEQIRKIIDVNLTGSFLCAQAFAKEFMERNPGPKAQETPSPTQDPASGRPGAEPSTGLAGEGGASIVMTGSMSGHIANFGLECAAYNASKAGVNQLAKNLAMEWGKSGIRVNTLSPGYIRTALTAALLDERPSLNEIWLRGSLLGRLSTPDEFRGPVVFMLSDASSFMTGADLLIDGGHTAT